MCRAAPFRGVIAIVFIIVVIVFIAIAVAIAVVVVIDIVIVIMFIVVVIVIIFIAVVIALVVFSLLGALQRGSNAAALPRSRRAWTSTDHRHGQLTFKLLVLPILAFAQRLRTLATVSLRLAASAASVGFGR